MTILFLDSSAFSKLFLFEAGTSELRRVFGQARNQHRVVSALGRLEVGSALERRLRRGELTQDEYSLAQSNLRASLDRMVQIDVAGQVIGTASSMVVKYGLRALDSIQLASAATVRDELDAGDTLLFIASDVRLLTAAVSEGLAAWDPASTVPPPAVPVN